MVKKLQALKAKKGFTLVELIVVIAIIGVLAAILVPTMLGMVTKSRVTSVNSTAASIKNNIDTFLTNADTAGYGMKKGKTANVCIDILVDANGNWSCAARTGGGSLAGANATDAFKDKGTAMVWGNTTTTTLAAGASKVSLTNPAELLCVELADLFPTMRSASIVAYLEGGKTLAVAYTTDASATAIPATEYPAITLGTATASGGFADTFVWDNSTAGVSPAGMLVGTAPEVPLGSGVAGSI